MGVVLKLAYFIPKIIKEQFICYAYNGCSQSNKIIILDLNINCKLSLKINNKLPQRRKTY